jgi:hypothetical protein
MKNINRDINSYAKIAMELINSATHEPRRGIFSDYCVYDPYRDIGILESLLQLSKEDLTYQVATAVVQKNILSGSKLLVTKHKNDLETLYVA